MTTSILPLRLGTARLGQYVEPGAEAPKRITVHGECWELVTDPLLDIALVTEDGDTAAQEAFAARLANILRLNVAHLFVTEDATINALVAERIAVAVARVIELDADRITSGIIDTSHLNAGAIAAAVATVIELNASRITSGTINTARLNTHEIAAAVANVIELNASRITSGTISTARLDASAIASAVATIIELNADRITSGTLDADRIAAHSITAAKILVDEELAAELVSAMTVATKRLIVTEDAILNRATIINGLAADVVSAATIYASQLVVAALDEHGDIVPGAVDTVQIADGAITTPKLTVTGDMSAAVVNAMTTNTKKLVVTEEAILNHATLIGDTVVDDINVTGKLIGTDGVFTGTVDFENVNVTGLQLVEKLEANSISADLIEGGAFVGESFTGGTFIGGEFRTSDTLPGQVTLSDTGFEDPLESGIPGPGVGVTPRNPDGFARFPGVGPSWGGMTVSGGRDATGRWATVEASPTSSTLRAVDEGGGGAGYISTAVGESTVRAYGPSGESGEVRSAPTSARLRTRTAGGALASEVNASPTASFMQTYGDPAVGRAYSQVDPQRATMNVVDADGLNTARITADGNSVTLFSATNGQRYLKLDDTGIWIETGGKSYNLEETAQDSGWNSFPVKGGITASSDLAWRNKNGVIYFRGTVDTNWTGGQYTEVVTGLPAEMRPASDMIALSPDSTNVPMVIMMTASGTIRVWKSSSGTRGTWMSMLSYPLG